MKSPLFLLFFCVVGYPPNWGKRPRYIDRIVISFECLTEFQKAFIFYVVLYMKMVIVYEHAIGFSSCDFRKQSFIKIIFL